MVDVAAPVLGGFQDNIVDAFGATAGWWIGHLLVVGILALSMVALQNRHHITNHSGFGRSTLMDAAATLTLSIICALAFRWHLLIVE